MQFFLIFLNVVTPVFTLVLLGYLVGPRLQLEARTLSRIAYYLFVPSFVFSTISQADIEASLAIRMTIYILIVHLLCAALGFGVAKLMGASFTLASAYVLIAVFGNVGNFGLSLVQFRLGEAAIVPATIYFLAIIIIAFMVSVGFASFAQANSGWGALLSVFKTPAIVAVIPAMLFGFTGLEVPLFINRITTLLGSAMIPTMLVTLGVQLAGVETLQINRHVVAATSVRLLGGPILAILLVIPFGLTGLARGAGILQSSMPAAVLASIIAIEYDLIPEFVTTTVLFSTLASLVTLTVILSLV
ncbi:MAG: AEC family transporter [Chloroflexota bacterium]